MSDPTDRPSAAPGGERLLSAPIDAVADAAGIGADASLVYGPPVERDSVTVIPVCRVSLATVGGRNTCASSEPSSGQGAGSVHAIPVGYITVKDGDAHYTPIRDPLKNLLLPLAAIACLTAIQIVRTVLRR
ncbi:Sporulation protein YtfJ (Spore_YtfJ) [Marinactinospora thermotolerans DSM 45154]|uniref:Sporulation protein YtfJ (Spore_YtfJ) n=1 Tax=Marinactinospora thermotolerans DSM 45154 TaxID=1122192 RepID=A0A1T4SGU3_9ACTN|nr:spore germination protein GerW family protein [Marinactinospora thermotolerans]SKA27417.1 Sporulation protein YtfJ (Spore_YtfJ) [Marinactinospora thermotolerans DSM 45154]